MENNSRFRVRFYMDNTYEVIDYSSYESFFQGSLADCEAWIRLREGGYF